MSNYRGKISADLARFVKEWTKTQRATRNSNRTFECFVSFVFSDPYLRTQLQRELNLPRCRRGIGNDTSRGAVLGTLETTSLGYAKFG